MQLVEYGATAVASYFLGSIPTGYLVARSRGVDIRKVGSGNIGATNVLRTLGKPAGIAVLAVDALKGFVACRYLPQLFFDPTPEAAAIVAAVGAILGHNYTVWLKFKGGKGVATSSGALLGLVPGGLLVAFVVWITFFFASGYVSLASIAGAVALPIGVFFTGGSMPLVWTCVAISLLAIYKHRANIQRLMNGTEHTFKKRNKKMGDEKPV